MLAKALAMPQLPTKIIIAASFGLLCFNAFSQESVNSGGGDAVSTEGSTSYSIGQPVYTTNQSGDGSSSMGVQQAYDATVITNTANKIGLAVELNVFPNPALDIVTLETKGNLPTNLHFEIQDLNGVTVSENRISQNSTTVPVDELSPATYIITVLSGSTPVSSFRIVKL